MCLVRISESLKPCCFPLLLLPTSCPNSPHSKTVSNVPNDSSNLTITPGLLTEIGKCRIYRLGKQIALYQEEPSQDSEIRVGDIGRQITCDSLDVIM
jgi:hypothetical protein